MSRCFDINCHDCKESLWIGQRDHIYTTKESLADLNEFLFKHEGHSLTFEYDEKNEYAEFERKENETN
ncbi:MAG: hypothetical protein KAS32_10705 [Candidatus Peribacteraceae bacterium]|nr:hypothetical protein [Candidatus Peribacteraceae bacterium]